MTLSKTNLFIIILLVITLFAVVFEKQGQITAEATSGTAQISFTVIAPPTTILFIENVGIFLNPDNKTVSLNWSENPPASNYLIYYGSNLTAIRNINTSNLHFSINVANVIDTNWTDSTAFLDIVRFYRVSAINSSAFNLSTTILGKQTYTFIASSDASKRNNLFALIYNKNYNFSKYLNAFCLEFPIICDSDLGIPTIQAIDRSDPEAQPFVTHPFGFVTGSAFDMGVGTGYKMLVNQSYNKTEVGIMPVVILINLTASSDASKRNNIFGDNYIENETFSDYLDAICADAPQICDSDLGIPTIQAIDRDDPEAQPFVTHPFGFVTGADFQMQSGEGYIILVNESIVLLLNNSVIT